MKVYVCVFMFTGVIIMVNFNKINQVVIFMESERSKSSSIVPSKTFEEIKEHIKRYLGVILTEEEFYEHGVRFDFKTLPEISLPCFKMLK